MKLRRHAKGAEGHYLSPLLIIQLPEDMSSHDLDYISQTLMDKNNPPEYCVFIGFYSHIDTIVETIKKKYTIVWISDYYCMASCKPTVHQYIPEADVKTYKDAFLMNLRDISVLLTPELSTLNKVMSCKSNTLDFCVGIHLLPMFGIVYPSNTGIRFEVERYQKIVFNELFIPFFTIEHLQNCYYFLNPKTEKVRFHFYHKPHPIQF